VTRLLCRVRDRHVFFENLNTMQTKLASATFALLASLSAVANATEGGTSVYPVGTENYTCCALPPPGLYGMAFVENYTATKLRDNSGNDATPPGFKVTANALVPRLVYVSKETVWGGSLGFHAILPMVNLEVTVPGLSQTKSGNGDIVLGAVLGYHHSPQLHTVAALDVITPTGAYNKNDLANIGKNHWAIQPVYGVSYIDPNGLNADAKIMYTFNGQNDATGYRDGQEFIVDYSLGWGLGNGWVLGVGGYIYEQTTDDSLNGNTVANNKGRAFALGPSIRYDSGKGWFVTAKFQQESNVANRAEGQAFWLKAVVPF
jgi:hypothetical protein